MVSLTVWLSGRGPNSDKLLKPRNQSSVPATAPKSDPVHRIELLAMVFVIFLFSVLICSPIFLYIAISPSVRSISILIRRHR